MKTIERKLERSIPSTPEGVFDAWLNSEVPGNPWNAAEKFILDPKIDGCFYSCLEGTSHYGLSTVISSIRRWSRRLSSVS